MLFYHNGPFKIVRERFYSNEIVFESRALDVAIAD